MTDQNLPPGWAAATLGEVGEVVSGATPKTGIAEFWGGQIPWITPDDLSKNPAKYTSNGIRSLTDQGYESCSTRLVPSGAVLFSSRAPIGYVTIANTSACTNQGFKTLIPDTNILTSEYLYWFLQFKTPDIRSRASGTTFKEISAKGFKETRISFPPLAEQQRIVDALEGHLSRLDAAVSATTTALARSRRLRERITYYAGNYSPSCGASAKPPAPVGVIDRDMPEIPSEWEWHRLGDIADVVGGVTKDSKKQTDPEYVEVPYLRVANVQRGHLDLAQVSLIRVPKAKAKQLQLRVGDVLLNEGGDRNKLGRGWVWHDEVPGAIHQNHVFRARIRDGIMNPKLLSWHANSCARWFEDNGKQSVNLASISLKKIKMLPVAVPPLEQQNDIVARIEDQSSLLDSVMAESERVLTRAVRLRQSLLRHAFSGQLVPQDPGDEPASASLERIRAERAARVKPKTKRRPAKRMATVSKAAPPVSTEPTGTYVQEELWK